MYSKKKIRHQIIDLVAIYLTEAMQFSEKANNEDKETLQQRSNLLALKAYLVLKQPRRVLRQLKRIEKKGVKANNESFFSFLYYTKHYILDNTEEMELWKSKVSLLNLKKAEKLINLNK